MKKILFVLAVSFFAFQLSCFATTTISGQTGIIKVVPPGGGAAITIKPGETVPPIVDGSTIIVVTGELTVATTTPSTVEISTRGNKISLPSNTTVQVSNNTNGAVKVYDSMGQSDIKTSDGKNSTLNQGQTIVIAGNIEAYQPPALNLGPIDTQAQIDNRRKDISPTTP